MRVYTVSVTQLSVTAAITLIQLKAGATCPLRLIRAMVGQTSYTTNTMLPIQINRKSVAATVTTQAPVKNGPATDPSAAAAVSDTGINATVEGTDGDILVQDVWNYLLGWTYLPPEKKRDFVGAAGIVGLKLPIAPGAAVTINADLCFEELA